MLEHVIDGLEILGTLLVEVLRLGLELLEPALRVDVDGIFGVLADVEFSLELLRCLEIVGDSVRLVGCKYYDLSAANLREQSPSGNPGSSFSWCKSINVIEGGICSVIRSVGEARLEGLFGKII
jgi:hypothetical protein